jgi:hypothetical protein
MAALNRDAFEERWVCRYPQRGQVSVLTFYTSANARSWNRLAQEDIPVSIVRTDTNGA